MNTSERPPRLTELLYERLNADGKAERLNALTELAALHKSGEIPMPHFIKNVNNHIHTTYSFSPYSPAKAVYLAWKSGLATAGIMDHDSAAGIKEFISAGKIIGLPVTVGVECRVSLKGTPFEGKLVNNPDQRSVAYMAMHAIPLSQLETVEAFLAPLREKRNERNRKMVSLLNKKIKAYGLELDFDRDVLPLSKHGEGGSVTERHILFALSSAITKAELPKYFLLGLFKAQLVESFYVDADEELPTLAGFIAISEKAGAIPAYAYLGDVGVSVTGDKKARHFEDAYLGELIAYLKNSGVKAVTFMPARNTIEQLDQIMSLCRSHGLFQISGEDINNPFQNFICDIIETPKFSHLISSAHALIGHERLCAENGLSAGMFSRQTIAKIPSLDDRISFFAGGHA